MLWSMSIRGLIFFVMEVKSARCGTTVLVVCRSDALLVNRILGCAMQASIRNNMQSSPDHLFSHITAVIAMASANRIKRLEMKVWKRTLWARFSSASVVPISLRSKISLTDKACCLLSTSTSLMWWWWQCRDAQTAMRIVICIEQLMAKPVGDGTVHMDSEASNT